MKKPRLTLLLCVLSLSLGACGDDDAGNDAGPGRDSGPRIDGGPVVDSGPNVDTGPDDDAGPGDAGPGDAGPSIDWAVRSHPCPGVNRTDAFHVDTDGTMWLGCGSGAEGEGLFTSSDDGANWDLVETSPPGIFENFRVLSIHRGFGDLLYVGGQRPGGVMAVSVDTSAAAPFATEAVLEAGGTVDTTFLASPFVTTASGAAFADSFNGGSALYRPDPAVGSDGRDWVVATDWEDDDSGHQILDMVVDGERFIGCGSTIAEPPFVYLPSMLAGAEPWEMTPVNLAGDGLGAFEGEMWGVDANASRVVVVGVDQDRNVGKIFLSGADRYESEDYAQIDIGAQLPAVGATDSTWARGVCMDEDRIVVVGEIQPLGVGDNTGFVLESTDGGATFTNMTPEGSPDTWSKCQIDDGGRVLVAGAGRVGIMD